MRGLVIAESERAYEMEKGAVRRPGEGPKVESPFEACRNRFGGTVFFIGGISSHGLQYSQS